MLTELRLTLPKDQRLSDLAWSIWSAGIYPWSWADQCGPDFLPAYDPVLQAGWQAYEIQQQRERGREFDEAMAAAVERAEGILAEQGMMLADHTEDDDATPSH